MITAENASGMGGSPTDIGANDHADSRSARPRWLGRFAGIAIVLTVLPTVVGVSASGSLGNGGTLRITDVVLPVAAALCLPAALKVRGFWVVAVLAWFCGFLALMGLYHGASVRWLGRDLRAPLYMVLGMIVTMYAVTDSQNHAWYREALVWLFGVVAVLVALSQVLPTALVGQSADDAIYYGSTATQLASRRAQIETDSMALAVLCGLVGLYVAGGSAGRLFGARKAGVVALSTFAILFVSYSRNTILGIGTAVLLALLAPVGLRGQAQIVAKINGLARAWARAWVLLICVVPVVVIVAVSGAFHNQISTYSTRVIGGLSSQAIATDSSLGWRSTESHLALASFNAHPILGDGLGTFYRPFVLGEPFTGDNGRVYVHNYYLWVLVRGGVLYAFVMAIVLIGGLMRLLLIRVPDSVERDWRLFAAFGLGALLAVAYVAPWPEQSDGAAIFGALLALAWMPPRSRELMRARARRAGPA